MSLYVGSEGRSTLMVVNHQQGRHTVEVYDWDGNALAHRTTIADPLMVSPNDLHALDHERFFVTNDHANPPGWKRTVEEYLQREISNVLYYDGAHFREAADGTTARVGRFRPRTASKWGAASTTSTSTPQGACGLPPNPKLLTFVRHVSDPSVPAPSQVFRIDPRNAAVEEVYLDLGTALSASSVGAFHDGRLLIGTVFDTKFLDCQFRDRG